MKKVNCITINTDASFHQEKKVGGYAFYIVCDLFKIQKAGKFKTQPKDANEAEIMCIGNAIAMVLAQKELPNTNYLLINTDSKVGMAAIQKRITPLGKKVHALWSKLILKTSSKNNKMRHVKAHSKSTDARSWVNEWCDKEAKKMMRKAVKDLAISHDPL